MPRMRLYWRKGIAYVELARGKAKSLKTSDPTEAESIFKEMLKEWHRVRIFDLESKNNISLGDFRDQYLESRTGLVSDRTIRHDTLSLQLLCDSAGAKTPLKLINLKRITDFINIRLAKGNKPQSINSYLRHIKSALSSAEELEFIKKKPHIKMLKVRKHLPRYLRKEEIDAIMKISAETRPEFHRMLVFYLWTGARRNEALTLQWKDVYLDDGRPRATLTGKGDKQRTVPLLPKVVDVLKPIRKDIGFVFPQINESTATHWFKKIVRSCTPPVDARLHDLRHTAATYMLACGIPITAVQEIMGHADLATTGIYAQVVKEHLHREMNKLRFE